MRPFLYVAALALVALVATWAYQVIDDTQRLMDEVDALHADILREREAISVLNAEWAWLNRPERLDRLAEAHRDALALVPLAPSHFAEVGAVAFQPPPPHAPGAAPEAQEAPPAPLVAAAQGLGPTAPAPFAAPAAPMAPILAAPEPPVALASLVGIDHISLGLPLPPARPAGR